MKSNLFLFLFLLPLIAFAQIIQLGQDIDGEAAGDLFGKFVSLSADGSIVAIGAYNNDGNGTDSGHVRVYQNTGDTWTQIGQDIDGEAVGDLSGRSVSLSADGNIVAIGAVNNNGNGDHSGHVRIYQNSGDTWTQIGQDIEGVASYIYSGHTVGLNGNGSIVAIGAPYYNGNSSRLGHVRIFQFSGGNWTQIGEDIDGEAPDDFSARVSLSYDGSIVAIGGSGNDGVNGYNSGHVRIYQNWGGTWTQLGQDIDGEAANDGSGGSVSLNADGSIVAIGAAVNDGNGNSSGHVRIYHFIGGNWTQIGQDIDGDAMDDNFGAYVSLNDEGGIIAIGAPNNDGNGTNSGQVKIFQNLGGTWTQLGQTYYGEEVGDSAGSVSLNADGSILVIGANFNDGNGTNSGHVRVFDLSSVMAIDDNSVLDFLVYPIPVNEILTVQSKTSIIQIEIYNTLGQQLLSKQNQNTIDISSLSQGSYLIRIKDIDGKTVTKKFIKE